jgi:hypothetical protein
MDPIVGGQLPGRNEPCPCGSGLRFKKCHRDPAKVQKAAAVAKEAYRVEMDRLIAEETNRNTQLGEQA